MYDFVKLGKEMTLSGITETSDASQVAADAASKLAISAVKGTRDKQDPKVTIAGACRGAMEAILLKEKDLPAAAVAILKQMAMVAQESSVDPAECMTWAMEGIAQVCKVAPAGAGDGVRTAIEENFMGAGEVFSGLLVSAGS